MCIPFGAPRLARRRTTFDDELMMMMMATDLPRVSAGPLSLGFSTLESYFGTVGKREGTHLDMVAYGILSSENLCSQLS